MIIRELEISDFDKGFLETLSNLSNVGNITKEKFLEIYSSMKRPLYNIFVAEHDGEIVGAITILIEQKFIHEGGKVGHIEDVVTRKGHEGKGIGKKLMEKAIEESKTQKCYKIILDCKEHNIQWYEKFGMKKYETCMRLDIIHK